MLKRVFSLKSFLFGLCLLGVILGSSCSAFRKSVDHSENTSIASEIQRVESDINSPDGYLRALELSLYYQGFDPDKTFHTLDGYLDADPNRNYDEVPRNSELIGVRKIRDQKKSFEYAKKAYELNNGRHPLVVSNLVNHYVSGISVAKDFDKAKELVESNIVNYSNSGFGLWYAYLYYKGIGVEQDLGKVKDFLTERHLISWKNFYIGKFAPYDREFAVYLLENDENKILSSYFMHLIYSGELNPDDKNPEKAKYWKNLYGQGMSDYRNTILAQWDRDISDLKLQVNTATPEGRMLMRRLAFKHLIKHKYHGIHFNKRIFVENPNYNPELAKQLIKDSGFNNWRLYYAMISLLGRAEDGDIADMKKYLQGALSGNVLSKGQKVKLSNIANELEKQQRRFYEAPLCVDNLIQ